MKDKPPVLTFKGKKYPIPHLDTNKTKAFYTQEEDIPEELENIVVKAVEEMYGAESTNVNCAECYDIKSEEKVDET